MMEVYQLKPQMDLKFIVIICHVDGPGELLALGFVVDLLNGNAPLLAPKRQKQEEIGCENEVERS